MRTRYTAGGSYKPTTPPAWWKRVPCVQYEYEYLCTFPI